MFWGTSLLFSTVAAPVYIPTRGLPFSTYSPVLPVCCLFDQSFWLMWGDISRGFWFIFPDISDVENLFMYLLTISMSSLEKMPIKTSSDHFKIRLFQVVWVIYIFWIITLYQIYHLQMSSPIQSVAFLFRWWFILLCKSF